MAIAVHHIHSHLELAGVWIHRRELNVIVGVGTVHDVAWRRAMHVQSVSDVVDRILLVWWRWFGLLSPTTTVLVWLLAFYRVQGRSRVGVTW